MQSVVYVITDHLLTIYYILLDPHIKPESDSSFMDSLHGLMDQYEVQENKTAEQCGIGLSQ